MKYSIWDNLFRRTTLKEKNKNLLERCLELANEKDRLEKDLQTRNEQVIQAVEVGKEWKNKFDSLNQQIQKDKEDLKNFLLQNTITK